MICGQRDASIVSEKKRKKREERGKRERGRREERELEKGDRWIG